jgi:hypothetical protein
MVFEYNAAGRRCYEKAGFREMGRRRESRWYQGRFWDEIHMDILASEFTSPVLRRLLEPDVEESRSREKRRLVGATRRVTARRQEEAEAGSRRSVRTRMSR